MKRFNIGDSVGVLCAEWAVELGLSEGIPVAAGIIDAHAGAVGSGISPGTMVKIIGTSTCDIAVASFENELPDIPGICGIAPRIRPAGLLRTRSWATRCWRHF